MKTACIHIMCSVCSISLPQHLLKTQLHCRRECWKRNWRFILPCGSRLIGLHILNLRISLWLFLEGKEREKKERERERETSGFNRSGTVCHLGYVILSDACVYFITSKQENTALSYWSTNTANFSFILSLGRISIEEANTMLSEGENLNELGDIDCVSLIQNK